MHYLNPAPAEAHAPTAARADATAKRARRPLVERADLRSAAILTVVLLVVGAVLGLLWAAICPPGPLAVVWNAKHQLVIDETEAYIATDARFGIIVAITGLVAGLCAWFVRPLRSMITAVALVVGSVGGSYLMSVVGYYARGSVNLDRPAGTVLAHAPLGVHIRGFFLLEAVVALLVFLLFVAFAEHDDLGRPDAP